MQEAHNKYDRPEANRTAVKVADEERRNAHPTEAV
jgi:hypothetical protein